MSEGKEISATGRVLFGLCFVAAGVMPFLATFDVGPLHSADINGPPWLGAAAGGAFIAAGLSVALGGKLPWLGQVFALLVVLGLASIANWIAFGEGARGCVSSFSIPFIEVHDAQSGLACRLPFGLGAVIMDGIAVYFVALALQKACGGAPRLDWLVTGAKWLMWLCLAPIFLLLLVVVIVPLVARAVLVRLRTGAWPRNEAFIRRKQAQAAAAGYLRRARPKRSGTETR
jgi:hypothetical protein